MKKIIKNRVYDTETAVSVGSWENTPYITDFNHYSEELFCKRTGEFFLYGNGNANSKYSKSCGQNVWCGSWAIKPLTDEEACEWAENHLDADTYAEWFEPKLEPDTDIVARLKAIRGDTPVMHIQELFPNLSPRTWEKWEQRVQAPSEYIVDLLEEVMHYRNQK